MNMFNKKKKIGLVLGSGAAKGIAHIGVLKVFDELKMKFDVIAGTSMGSLIGALYAGGMSGKDIEELALGIDKSEVGKLFKVTLEGPGFINGKFINEYIDNIMPVKNIQDLPLPFGCCACSITDGREITFTKGSISDALRASISIPGIITPHKSAEIALVDGGLVNPVPVSLCRQLGADVVIAVNVLNTPVLKNRVYDFPDQMKEISRKNEVKRAESFNEKLKGFISREIESFEMTAKGIGSLLNLNDELNIINIISQTYLIGESNLAKFRLGIDSPDVIIEPDMKQIKHFDFTKAEKAILLGEKEAWKVSTKNKIIENLRK